MDSDSSLVLFRSLRKDISVWSQSVRCAGFCFRKLPVTFVVVVVVIVPVVSMSLVESSRVGMARFCELFADDSDVDEVPEDVESDEEHELDDSVTFREGFWIDGAAAVAVVVLSSVLPVVPVTKLKNETFWNFFCKRIIF